MSSLTVTLTDEEVHINLSPHRSKTSGGRGTVLWPNNNR